MKFVENGSLQQLKVAELSWGPSMWFHISQFKNNYFTEMCSGSEEVSYLPYDLRFIDFGITQL